MPCSRKERTPYKDPREDMANGRSVPSAIPALSSLKLEMATRALPLASSAIASAVVAANPPIAWRSSAVPVSPPSSNRFRPFASTRLQCTCMPLPARSRYGFAMKLAEKPWRGATDWMNRRKRTA